MAQPLSKQPGLGGPAVAWFRAVRGWSLPASVVPVLVGAALAYQDGQVNPTLFLLTLTASGLVQIGTNLVDEYADHVQGKGLGKVSAPYKVIALGLLSPAAVRNGALLAFGIATLMGLSIVAVVGWPVLAVALASLGAAYFYSAGPRPLGDLALGEPLVFLFMGPVMVLGTYYVQLKALTWEGLALSLPVGFLVATILVVNDLRDAEGDRQHGKRTPITLWGAPFGQRLFLALVVAAFLVVAGLALRGAESLPLLLVVFSLPKAASAVRLVRGRPSPERLTTAIKAAAGLHLQFGLLLAVGLLLGLLVRG